MEILKSDNYTIYLPGRFPEELEKFVKEEILKFKKKVKRYISGYYKVYVYANKIYGIIIDLKKEEDFNFFKDFVELDISVSSNNQMLFKFDDYFSLINKSSIYFYNNKYYVDIDDLNKKEFLKLSEFSEIVYGNDIITLKEKLKKIN